MSDEDGPKVSEAVKGYEISAGVWNIDGEMKEGVQIKEPENDDTWLFCTESTDIER